MKRIGKSGGARGQHPIVLDTDTREQPCRPLTPTERKDLIHSIISSRRLEGIEPAHDDVARIVDRAAREQHPDTG